MSEITQKITCPMCYHKRFRESDNSTADSLVGACCIHCHYILNADDVLKIDRTLARSLLFKSVDR